MEQRLTLAILTKAALRLLFSPAKMLFDWLYDDKPRAWLTPGGHAANDTDLFNQWNEIYTLQAAFTNDNDAREIVDTFISRGHTPLSTLAFYVSSILKRDNAHDDGRTVEDLAPGERLCKRSTDNADDAELSLQALGYTKRASITAVGAAVIAIGEDASTEDLIKQALKKE